MGEAIKSETLKRWNTEMLKSRVGQPVSEFGFQKPLAFRPLLVKTFTSFYGTREIAYSGTD